MKNRRLIISVLAILLFGFAIAFIVSQKEATLQHSTGTPVSVPSPAIQHFSTQDIPGIDKNFQFTADIPTTWQVEAVPTSQAIALFDPSASGNSNLEKSQVFIRFFSANQFLALSTVTIYNRQSLQIKGRPAVRYDIEKKASVPNFLNQPIWRNERHVVTDIRTSDISPAIFYVIAKNPELDEATYEQFLQSIAIQQ